MKNCTPEQAGISSRQVRRFFESLEAAHLSTHSVIMARGDRIFAECYYAPFHRNFPHRMYSVSKSFVAIAVGFCEQDGLFSLDDKVISFFPEYAGERLYGSSRMREATVRDYLTMRTPLEREINWFRSGCTDRTRLYFQNEANKFPGTQFQYDSSGTYVLGVVVEKLTGKPFLDYLREKCLGAIGFSGEAFCLQCPGGHSWGDSGVICTANDLLLFARFVMNGGKWNGKQYLNSKYVKAATTPSVSTDDYGFLFPGDTYGYGYYFWGEPQGCFSMLGMGGQIALCDPKHDFIFIINSDNQGNPHLYTEIENNLFRNVIESFSDDPLPDDPEERKKLNDLLSSRKLFCLDGVKASRFAEQIDGKKFVCEDNPMGIEWFTLRFEGDRGTFFYRNRQGKKQMPFGFGHNEYAKFPETGYSDRIGTVPAPGNQYDAAFSADWVEPQKLRIRVQIIDRYFGNLGIVFGFSDGDHVTLRMTKCAEDFLKEYNGIANATAEG